MQSGSLNRVPALPDFTLQLLLSLPHGTESQSHGPSPQPRVQSEGRIRECREDLLRDANEPTREHKGVQFTASFLSRQEHQARNLVTAGIQTFIGLVGLTNATG
ncbi:hypothetical protein NHX12_004053 [Muraenolepis orangiensis]|uniref:Uncharacterized protein n=1 Tax=Muraenolepis orangiensis TaxID=630683 RepID=A0A9Q0IF66_9TELE|nr:hypothetical protein NHX12_004053 [Muraenolepis orangiensis]